MANSIIAIAWFHRYEGRAWAPCSRVYAKVQFQGQPVASIDHSRGYCRFEMADGSCVAAEALKS